MIKFAIILVLVMLIRVFWFFRARTIDEFYVDTIFFNDEVIEIYIDINAEYLFVYIDKYFRYKLKIPNDANSGINSLKKIINTRTNRDNLFNTLDELGTRTH